MNAATMRTPAGLRALALGAALALAALASFGPVQHASADGAHTITFTSPATGDTNHISFTTATDSNQTALTTNPSTSDSAPPAPAAVNNSAADTGTTTAVGTGSSGN